MKQFNVKDDTHALGKALSYETHKSLIVVVEEALEMYDRSLKEGGSEGWSEDVLIGKLLRRAADVIARGLCETMSDAIPQAVTEAIGTLLVARAEESAKRAQLLRESEDLPVLSHEEVYGEKPEPKPG